MREIPEGKNKELTSRVDETISVEDVSLRRKNKNKIQQKDGALLCIFFSPSFALQIEDPIPHNNSGRHVILTTTKKFPTPSIVV
jgi:hypothetical protein